jgi:hypothetical protein
MAEKCRVSDGVFETRHFGKTSNIKHLCRVVTGSDGILHYSPLRARDRVNLLTRPYPSLPSLSAQPPLGCFGDVLQSQRGG